MFFLCLPQERLQSQVRLGIHVLCVQGAAAVTHHPEWKILELCSVGRVALGGFSPSFTSLFLLDIVASRKQGRPCKQQPDKIYLTQNRGSYFDSCV